VGAASIPGYQTEEIFHNFPFLIFQFSFFIGDPKRNDVLEQPSAAPWQMKYGK